MAADGGATSAATGKNVAKGATSSLGRGSRVAGSPVAGSPVAGSPAAGADTVHATGSVKGGARARAATKNGAASRALANGVSRAVAVIKTAGKEVAPERPRVRDRILETAGELFYARGIRCVGVDSIATEAGTNKMSLYRNFPSKEELVAEYLREQEREYWSVWDATIEPFEGDPRRQLEALFDGFLERARCKNDDLEDCKVRRGCALGNAAVEIPEDDENLHAIVLAYKSELRRRLRTLSREAGASEADALGDALMLLLEGGCYTLSTFSGTSGPIASMAKAARALISIHLR